MAQAEPSLDGAQTKTSTEARVFDAAGHGGGVDEQHDTKAKIEEALETATDGATGDRPVERSDSVAVVTGQAIPAGGVSEHAKTSLDAIQKLLSDPGYIDEFLSRQEVQRHVADLCEAIREIDLSDCDEDQWRV